MRLGMTGEGIAPQAPMPSPESRRERLSTSPEVRGKNSAFSLVELSIVLVILGLLVGGVLAGQSLIRAAELRAVSTEYSRYVTSMQTFRDKYFSFPGDFNKATSFWGNLGGTNCTNNAGTGAVTTGTCDGNGDGQVGAAAAASQTGEQFQFWRQLAFAGLVEGSYSGLAGSANQFDGVLGVNSPRSKMNNAGWGVQYVGAFAGGGTFYSFDYGNLMTFGALSPGAIPQGAQLKPEEAWNIDTKMDDGKPGSGKILAVATSGWYGVSGNTTTCVTSTSNTDKPGAYNLTVSSAQCALAVAQGF